MTVHQTGNGPAAHAYAAEAREQLGSTYDPELSAEIDCIEGFLAVFQGEVERAATYLRRAVAGATEHELRWASLYCLGWVLVAAGDLDLALSSFNAALAFSQTHDETICRARALVSVGMVHSLRGDPEQAVSLLIEGLRLSQLIGDPYNGAQCLEILGWVACTQQDWRDAGLLMAAADVQSRALGIALLFVPSIVARHDWYCDQIRSELGAEQFKATWAQGAGLDFDQSVTLALDTYQNR